MVIHAVQEVARQAPGLVAVEQVAKRSAGGHGLEQPSDDGRTPDPSQPVPAVSGQHPGVDQGHARQLVEVRSSPREPDRPSEVVHDQVDARDAEDAQSLVEERRVAGDGVLEAGRRRGVSEVGQVEGHRARDRPSRRHEPRPVLRRPGVPVHEHHRLALVRRSGG